MAGISLIQMAVSQRNNYHFEFSSKGGKIFQFNPWQSTDVAQTLIELERRLGSEWYLRFENCRDNRIDYVLVYKINDEDDARREARERFEERLVEDNLELVRWKKKDCWSLNDSESDEVFVLVHTPFDRLALECQSVKMAMPLKGQKCPQHQVFSLLNSLETDEEVDFVTAPFSLTRLSVYEGSDNLREFFTPAVASFLTHHILINTDSSEEERIQRGTTTKGLSFLLHTKAYEDAFVLHPYSPYDPCNTPSTQVSSYAHNICLHTQTTDTHSTAYAKADLRRELANSWCRWFKFQPLRKIKNYFGEKLAFYFAWLGLLSSSLIIPALLGTGVFVFGVTRSSTSTSLNATTVYEWMGECFDNTATPVFSLTICVWGTVFLELWKRKHSRLQYEWNVDHYDENEPDRPQFYGTTVVRDPVTKLEEVLYPLTRKFAKFATSLLFVFTMILVVLASLVGVIMFRLIFEHDWLSHDRFDYVPADRLLPILTASILNGISILVLKQLYNRMALKLTDWENHRTQSAYEDSLVVKLFAFHFADSYASLFYIAFLRNTKFKGGFAGLGSKYHDSCGDDYDCMTMLTINVAVLMFMQPLATVIITIVWPWIKKKWRGRRKKQTGRVGAEFSLDCPKKTEFAVKVQHVAKLLEQQRYMQTLHNFHLTEYSEKVIMYGYLMIFATAFPLAPVVALLTNIFDLRLDAKRLVWHTRRPVAEIAHKIGIWQQVLVFINFVAVISNGFLIAYTSDIGKKISDDYGEEGRLWLFIVFEHVVFTFMLIVSFCIPDVPRTVKNAKRREKVIVDQVIQDSAFKALRRDFSFVVKKPSMTQSTGVSLTSSQDDDML